jgi:SAM-dependent methyltransferase
MGPSRSFFDSPPGRALGRLIHAARLRQQPRRQSLATSLFRNIRQVSAFEEPLKDIPSRGRMDILVAACSIGCEAYTVAGFLAARFPDLTFAIEAFDIDPSAIEHARAAAYGPEHLNEAVFDGPFADAARALVERNGTGWRIRSDILDRMTFSVDDALLKRPEDDERYDAIFAQNFMVHMDDATATQALVSLASRLRHGGAMFLGGMTLDMRAAATRRAGLEPVDWRVAEIHDEDHVRRNAWPFAYWSLEPFDGSRPDSLARYATIFRKT